MSLLRFGWRAGLPLALLPAAVAAPVPMEARAPAPVVRVLLQEAPSLELEAGSSTLRLGDGAGRTLLELAPGGPAAVVPQRFGPGSEAGGTGQRSPAAVPAIGSGLD